MTGLEVFVLVVGTLWCAGNLAVDYLKHRNKVAQDREWIRLYEKDSATFERMLQEQTRPTHVTVIGGQQITREQSELMRSHLDRLSREQRRPS